MDSSAEQIWDMAHSDYLLTNSEFAAETMIQYGIAPEKIRIVHMGVDTELFQPPSTKNGRDRQRFRVLYVGGLSLAKGVQYLLEAYRRLGLGSKRAELVLVGRVHPNFQQVMEQYAGLYTHLGHVPQYTLPPIYGSASVFVMPSLQEGFAKVVYEAMACGTLVVATDNTGSAVRDGVDGYVVPARDVEALADRLLLLYRNPDLRAEMGLSARERIEEGFTWGHYGRRLLKVYEEIVLGGS